MSEPEKRSAQILSLKPTGSPTFKIIEYSCKHNEVQVDPESPWLKCLKCGKELNPIYHLYQLSLEEGMLEFNVTKIREVVEALERKTRTKCDHCGKMTNIRK